MKVILTYTILELDLQLVMWAARFEVVSRHRLADCVAIGMTGRLVWRLWVTSIQPISVQYLSRSMKNLLSIHVTWYPDCDISSS